MLAILLTSTIVQIMPTTKASNDYLLEIDGDYELKICCTEGYHLAQEFKTNSAEIWKIQYLSFYGLMVDADVEVGIKESLTSSNWIVPDVGFL